MPYLGIMINKHKEIKFLQIISGMMIMIRIYLLTLLILTTSAVQSQFLTRTTQTDLNAFTSDNGQWVAIGPNNNTLGTHFYQGLNFGFDANNYVSLVNPIGTNDIYFGRWAYAWQGWNKVWHSGNLNNSNTDFQTKNLSSSKINLTVPYSEGIEALNIDVTSFGTMSNAQNSHFLRVRDLGAYTHFIIKGDGSVGIGTTTTSTYKLSVNGTIRSKEVKVEANWSDFVFDNDYELRTLEEVEEHINEMGHLPEIPSEAEVTENGINLGEMDAKLLQKIEELTLYMIDMNKRMNEIEQENLELKESNKELKEEISTLKSN